MGINFINSGFKEMKAKCENIAKVNTKLKSQNEELFRKMAIPAKKKARKNKHREFSVVQVRQYLRRGNLEARDIPPFQLENVFSLISGNTYWKGCHCECFCLSSHSDRRTGKDEPLRAIPGEG